MIEYKLQIQHYLNIQIQVVTCCRIGLQNVMIKITMVKYKTLLNQQKQTAQLIIQQLNHYLLSALVLCIKRIQLIITAKLFLSAANELIIFKLAIVFSIITDFQF